MILKIVSKYLLKDIVIELSKTAEVKELTSYFTFFIKKFCKDFMKLKLFQNYPLFIYIYIYHVKYKNYFYN